MSILSDISWKYNQMRLLKKFIDTIRYYCQGKGNPWRLILVWYFLLNALSLIIGFAGFFLTLVLGKSQHISGELIAFLLNFVFGILGLIITFIYPLIFIYAIWRCAFNTERQTLGYLIRFLIIPFIYAHFILGRIYLFNSVVIIYEIQEIIRQAS